MQIDIHDVGHGQCAVITAPNGNRIMVDCGTRFRDDRYWWPSIHHLGQEIIMLALLNLDEDHIRDFGSMMERCNVRSVLTNPTIGAKEFQKLKSSGMGPGASAYLEWLNAPRGPVALQALDWGGIVWQAFWNPHGGPCENTNDLSLALFVQWGGFTILFAGDLEAKGWAGMLANPDFCAWAAKVNIFVASHHGRANGCCEALFRIMKPELVIISDDYKQHETQETHGFYYARCHGATVINNPSERRYVVTTRSDGAMRINASVDGSWRINWGISVADWPASLLKTQSAANDLFAPANSVGDLSWLNYFAQK
jgi:beta-lactamase superfamily II metal-dependent hydrolase